METTPIVILIIGILSLAAGSVLGYFARQTIAKQQAGTIEARIEQQLHGAKQEAREILIQAKNRAVAVLEEAKKEENLLKEKLLQSQSFLAKREDTLERRLSDHERKEAELEEKIEKVRDIKKKVEEVAVSHEKELERIAALTKMQAREELLTRIEREYQEEIISHVQRLEHERRAELEKRALNVLVQALQRYARSHTSEFTTSTVPIPDDEHKGRIIGKEGRNIKAFERETGVEVMIDETPGVITLSAFDPVRREVAKIALENLIKDGRIQPARIEEKVREAEEEIKVRIQEAGEQAVFELKILDLPPQVVYLLGRLHYRYSFGQNILLHSIEAAHVAGMLAEELGADVEVAKRGALLHDIGKAVDHELKGTHVELGRKILQKYGVGEAIVRAMESHHDEYPYSSPEAFIVSAAESASAARPGARRETLENYLKRVEDLERIAGSFEGVEKSYAIQAGRELRVFVFPEKIDDLKAFKLARDIASQIESELKYPGEIKVNVIRETRSVEYAR